jgi:hypothetical protein
MASLPVLPTLAGLRPPSKPAADLAAGVDVDVKLRLARRLRAEDAARRTTSTAPPGPRR